MKKYLDKAQFKLYTLIWNRSVACQMNRAVIDQTRVDASPDQDQKHRFSVTGQIIQFPGFLAVYEEGKDEEDTRKDDKNASDADRLPSVNVGDELKISKITPSQHFTKGPARFSEATLVKELEKLGIGRPSTYAAIISTIQDKKYVKKVSNQFRPTEIGEVVTDLLVMSFPEILDVHFTAGMEDDLDAIEQGKQEWTQVLQSFHTKFEERLTNAEELIRKAKQEPEPTSFKCPNCEKPMGLRIGRNGRYLACEDWASEVCKTTMDVKYDEDGILQPVEKPNHQKCT